MRARARGSWPTLMLVATVVLAACGEAAPDPASSTPAATPATSATAPAASAIVSPPPETAVASDASPASSVTPVVDAPTPAPTAAPSAPSPASSLTLALVEPSPELTVRSEPEPPAPAEAGSQVANAAAGASPAPSGVPPSPTAAAPSPSASSLDSEPTPSPTPFPSFAAQIIGYLIDPATALPVVPEGVGGPWWWEGPPVLPLDPSLRYTSEPPAADAVDPDQRRVSVLALFDSHEHARTVAEALAAAAGDPAAEAAWLEAAGQDGSAGFGWLGSSGSTTPFVQAIDRWLIVSELAYDPQDDPGDGLDVAPRYGSPLVRALDGLARELVVEDTWAPDKSVAFDLACRGEPARLLTLSQDLADNAEIYDMQPVWIEPGITSEQRRARRTLRLVDTLDNATLSALVDDTEFQRRASIVRNVGAGGTVATEEALADLAAYIEEWILASRPDLEPLAYLLDPDVLQASAAQFSRRAAVEVLAGELTRPQDVASGQFAAAPFGAHEAPIPWIMGEAPSYAEQEDDRLTMSLGLFHGVAAGLGPLVDHLTANGCTDLRVNFLDYGYGASLRG